MAKSCRWNENEPTSYPFPLLRRGSSAWDGQGNSEQAGGWRFDWDRFDPVFFRNVETCVGRLGEMGIEADVILLHAYDHLCGIHNGARNYDHARRWVTHESFQGHPRQVPQPVGQTQQKVRERICQPADLLGYKSPAPTQRLEPPGLIKSVQTECPIYSPAGLWYSSDQGRFPVCVGLLER